MRTKNDTKTDWRKAKMAKYENHNVTRCNRAIDEMIKIQDSGRGNELVTRILDLLNELRSRYEESN